MEEEVHLLLHSPPGSHGSCQSVTDNLDPSGHEFQHCESCMKTFCHLHVCYVLSGTVSEFLCSWFRMEWVPSQLQVKVSASLEQQSFWRLFMPWASLLIRCIYTGFMYMCVYTYTFCKKVSLIVYVSPSVQTSNHNVTISTCTISTCCFVKPSKNLLEFWNLIWHCNSGGVYVLEYAS